MIESTDLSALFGLSRNLLSSFDPRRTLTYILYLLYCEWKQCVMIFTEQCCLLHYYQFFKNVFLVNFYSFLHTSQLTRLNWSLTMFDLCLRKINDHPPNLMFLLSFASSYFIPFVSTHVRIHYIVNRIKIISRQREKQTKGKL